MRDLCQASASPASSRGLGVSHDATALRETQTEGWGSGSVGKSSCHLSVRACTSSGENPPNSSVHSTCSCDSSAPAGSRNATKRLHKLEGEDQGTDSHTVTLKFDILIHPWAHTYSALTFDIPIHEHTHTLRTQVVRWTPRQRTSQACGQEVAISREKPQLAFLE